MKTLILIVLILSLLLPGVALAQEPEPPSPNVIGNIPDGWWVRVADDGSVTFANSEEALANTFFEPLPLGGIVVAMASAPASSMTLDQGGDYALGQIASTMVRVARVDEQILPVPRLERVPELDSNSITLRLDAIDATFWIVAIPGQINKNEVMLAFVKGAINTHREDIVELLLTLRLAKPTDA